MKRSVLSINGRRPAQAVLAGCAAVLALTACSSEPVVPDGPYAENIRAAQARVTSDFQKEVFSDGVITREEYTEALDRYVSCMDDGGFTVDLEPQDGYFTFSMHDAAGISEASDACRVGTVDEIEPIYVDMLLDPTNRTPPEAMRDCLVAAGKVDPSVTVAEITEQFDSIMKSTSILVDYNDPAVLDCISDPFTAPPSTP